VGGARQHPALYAEACLIDPGSLRHQAHLQPVQRRVCNLVPNVEEVAAAILEREYILSRAVQLNPFVGECQGAAWGYSVQVPEDATNHRGRIQHQLLSRAEVVACPQRPRLQSLVVVARFEVQSPTVGNEVRRHVGLAIGHNVTTGGK